VKNNMSLLLLGVVLGTLMIGLGVIMAMFLNSILKEVKK